MDLYDAYGCPISQIAPHLESTVQQQEEHSASASGQTTTKPNEPPQRPVSLDDPVSTQKEQPNSYEEKHYRLQKRGLWVQAFLCLFTAPAFAAAAYYAYIAKQQLRTMIDTYAQARKSAAPWLGIEQASIIAAQPKYAWSPALPYPTIYIETSFSVKNYGSSPAFREHQSIRVLPVPSQGERPPALRVACEIEEYRSPGHILFFGDVGEMILPNASIAFGSSQNMNRDAATPLRDLKRLWITICILYEDSSGTWHYSGYRYITSQGNRPASFADHPGWSFIPFTQAYLIAASAD